MNIMVYGVRQAGMVLEQCLRIHILFSTHEAERESSLAGIGF